MSDKFPVKISDKSPVNNLKLKYTTYILTWFVFLVSNTNSPTLLITQVHYSYWSCWRRFFWNNELKLVECFYYYIMFWMQSIGFFPYGFTWNRVQLCYTDSVWLEMGQLVSFYSVKVGNFLKICTFFPNVKCQVFIPVSVSRVEVNYRTGAALESANRL